MNDERKLLSKIPPIHPEGIKFVFIFAGITILFGLLWAPLWVPGVILTLWCAWFFRNPERQTPSGKGLVIAPADGKICLITEATWPEELREKGPKVWRVSIFMNVFNVHVNRSPMKGIITKLAYVPGKFFNASLDKASKDNERQLVEIKTTDGKDIAFVQIAGLVARRIVCFVKEGQNLGAGEIFGLIRFGSRVDIYLPKGVKPTVEVGQITTAGVTVIAKLARNKG
ncbi:MAG: phosphatidylserine decarboxylase [Sphingomonadales bacterium]